MVQHVINSAIVHIIWAIWIERNQRRFHNMHKPMTTLFNCILVDVKLSYNLVLAKGNSDMKDYKISRLFNIPFEIKKISVCSEIHWCPPIGEVVKFNCDGSSIGAQPSGAIGIVIRGSTSFLGAIASNIGYATALEAEFSACMRAMAKAKDMQLNALCLETDSIRVVNVYNKHTGVPWQMRARWFNCIKFCETISCSCVHVFREGNQVADALAKNGQSMAMYSSQWWPSPPPFISSLLYRDSFNPPYARLSSD